jgi:hypothetical protein
MNSQVQAFPGLQDCSDPAMNGLVDGMRIKVSATPGTNGQSGRENIRN